MMAFEFKPKQSKSSAAKHVNGETVLKDKSMEGRVKQEQDRRKYATDSEFWICLCFRSEKDREAFRKKLSLADGPFILGIALRESLHGREVSSPRRGFSKKQHTSMRTPNPFDGLKSSGDLAEDSKSEAAALLRAFKAVEKQATYRNAVDSHIWICVAFRDREDVERFLTEFDLRKYGEKYIDASAWLASL